MAASLIVNNEAFCLATWHQTVFFVFRSVATVQQMKSVSAACESLLASSRGPVTCLAVVQRSSPPPVDVVRREMAIGSRNVVPKFAAAVIVAEGGGFRSALVRSVIVFLTTIVPHRVPFTFSGSVAEAVDILGDTYQPQAEAPPSSARRSLVCVRSSETWAKTRATRRCIVSCSHG
jgi:hypothetical protein